MHFKFKNTEQKEEFIGNQAFSGIDLDRDEKEAGIVYPYDFKEEIVEGITSSSIIDLIGTDNQLLKHTEVRVCNTIDKEQIQYDKLETASIVIYDDRKTSFAKKLLFGINNEEELLEGYIESKDKINIKEFLEAISVYKEFKNTFTFIDSGKIKEERISYKSYYKLPYKNDLETSLFDDKIIENQQTNELFEQYVVDKDTPEDIKERFERLSFGNYDFEYISMEDIDEFHNFFTYNRKLVQAGFLESFIMDSYAYDCTNKKQVEEFRGIFKDELKKDDLSILTDYVLEKLKKYREKIDENNKSDYLSLF